MGSSVAHALMGEKLLCLGPIPRMIVEEKSCGMGSSINFVLEREVRDLDVVRGLPEREADMGDVERQHEGGEHKVDLANEARRRCG